MSNAQDCSALEFFINEQLDCLLGDNVYVCCSLIQYHNSIASQNSPDYADQLTLSNAEIFTLLLYFEVKAFVFLLLIALLRVFC